MMADKGGTQNDIVTWLLFVQLTTKIIPYGGKTMKKSFIAFLSVIMILSFAACNKGGKTGGEKTAVTGAGVLPIVNEKITLSVFAAQQGIVENLETNYATKWLEEKTNIHLEWNAVPAGEFGQKFSVLVNSGSTLPDIIMASAGPVSYNATYSYGSQGIFLPLNDLIEKYGVEIKRIWSVDPEVKKQMTSPDGNMYALGAYYHIKHINYINRVYINTEWLRNLNLPYPTTTEELYNTLVAFRDRDPNRNGLKDELPFTGANSSNSTIQWIVNSFIFYGDGVFNTKNGKLQQVVTAPEYREALRYIRRLYSEGLIDNQMFSQSMETLRQIVNGDYNRAGVIGVMTYSSFTDPYSEQAKVIEMLPPVAGPQGVRLSSYYPSTWNPSYFLTKDCKNPEAAFRLGDYLSSEEANAVTFQGEEGVDWVKPSPDEIAINGKPARIKVINSLPSQAMQNKGWMWMAPQVDIDFVIDGSYFDPSDPWYIEYRLYKGVTEAMEPYAPKEGWIPPLTFTEDELSEMTPISNELNNYLGTARMQFITGELDIDKDWDNYLKTIDSLNIRRLQEITQTVLDRYNK
jgi:putative aldouronate transport system substrate-binding protein